LTFYSKIGILELAVNIFNYIFLKGFRIKKFPMCLTLLIIFWRHRKGMLYGRNQE